MRSLSIPPEVQMTLDGQVRPVRTRRSEHVALVRLDPTLLLALLDRPGSVDLVLDAGEVAVDLDQATNRGLQSLMLGRRRHDLDGPLQVRHPRRRVVSAHGEEALVVLPREAVEMHVLVADRRVVALTKLG
jgi:hypothetical protein